MAIDEPNDGNRSPEEIERELEHTRNEIGKTLEAIQHKITPGQLASDAYGYVRGNGTEFAKNLGVAAKNNPLPVALMGIGVAWLMMGGGGTPSYLRGRSHDAGTDQSADGGSSMRSAIGAAGGYAQSAGGAARNAGRYAASAGRSAADAANRTGSSLYRTGQSIGETASGAGRRAGDMAAGASERVREMADDVRELASEWSESASGFVENSRERLYRASEAVQEQTMHMRDNATSLLREQPLVVGALGLAVGALLGAMIPLSRRENEAMGETRDQLLDQAKDMGKQALDQASESAKGIAGAAAEAAQEEAGKRGLTGDRSEGEAESEDKSSQSNEPVATHPAAGSRSF